MTAVNGRRAWIGSCSTFSPAPLLDGHAEAQQRVQNPALAFVRLVAIQVEKVGRLGEEFRAQELADVFRDGWC